MKLGILFGSDSSEHDISLISASSIIEHLDKNKYEIIPIYLSKQNEFYIWQKKIEKIKATTLENLSHHLKKIKHPFEYFKTFDLIWIMIHGKNGEDGILSSIFSFLKIPYLANKTEASVITMNKVLTKIILEKNGVKTSPYLNFSKYQNEYLCQNKIISKKELLTKIKTKIDYPCFIKPAKNGSSIGIKKVSDEKEMELAIENVLKIDHQILIEKEIKGRELECAILEKEGELYTSVVGEIVSINEFYDYEAKYQKKSKIIIPAYLDKKVTQKIQDIAKQVFRICDCHLYSRVDFFLTDNNKIFVNEINTIPGFTSGSMFTMLWEASNIKYTELLDLLINESLNGKE